MQLVEFKVAGFFVFPLCLQGLQVVQCPRSASVTRRAAGLPMLILSILAAEDASKARPLLALSVQTLMDTARTPVLDNWDQTLDLPQVCGCSCKNEPVGVSRKTNVTVRLPPSGVCSPHSSGAGAGSTFSSRRPSVCIWNNRLVLDPAQFHLLGHEKCSTTTLQWDTHTHKQVCTHPLISAPFFPSNLSSLILH